jgi:hypothetical protein
LTYTRSAHTAWRRIGEETIVINLATRRMVCLNGPAGAVWDRLEAGADVAALAAALAPGAPAAALSVASEFVAALQHEGLVESQPAPAAGEQTGATGKLPPGFVPPRLTWNEELLRFGGACGKQPGAGGTCIGHPHWS